MLRPSTRLKLALRVALRRRFGWAALRALRVGLRRALADHQVRTVGPAPYVSAGELQAIETRYARSVRRLLKRWPRLSFVDERSNPTWKE